MWCGLNEEQSRLENRFRECKITFASIHGGTPEKEREERLDAWLAGRVQVLISKPAVFGFGMNFQHCARMAFVGLSDSYEAYYQAIRRCWRFGQQRPVRADIVLSEAEQAIHANVLRKEAEAEHTSREMIRHLAAYEHAEIAGQAQRMDYQPGQVLHVPAWLKGTPCK